MTWTTEQIRAEFADQFSPRSKERREIIFNSWLATHDAEVARAAAEKAWDECAQDIAEDWYWHDGGRESNPYRKPEPPDLDDGMKAYLDVARERYQKSLTDYFTYTQ